MPIGEVVRDDVDGDAQAVRMGCLHQGIEVDLVAVLADFCMIDRAYSLRHGLVLSGYRWAANLPTRWL